MSEYVTPAKDRVPFLQKAAFGSGHLVNNLLPGALGVFSFFLLTAFGMDPFLAGLLGGLPRLFDAVTDPIMGYITDNTIVAFWQTPTVYFHRCHRQWTVIHRSVAIGSGQFPIVQFLVLSDISPSST